MANKKVILTIYNNHTDNCGEPPTVDNTDSNHYCGYLQNERGEQWFFPYDYGTGRGLLRGGDAGWDKNFAVVNGRAVGLILNIYEQQWLTACWNAATVLRKSNASRFA